MSNKSLVKVLVKEELITVEDEELVNRLFKSVDLNNYKIINTQYYKPFIEPKEIVVTLGKFIPRTMVQIAQAQGFIELPRLVKLHDQPGNEDDRQEAFTKLKALSDTLNSASISPQTFRREDLPALSVEQLLALEEELVASGATGFTGLNQQGKTVRIRISADDKEPADLVVNLHELLVMKLAIDLLELKEVQVVPADRQSNRSVNS